MAKHENENEKAPIYHQDQAGWSHRELYALWRYLNRLVQHMSFTRAQIEDPTSRHAKLAAKKVGTRDDEVRAMDLAQMDETTLHLLKGLLVATQRYESALAKFSNLRGLDEFELEGREPVRLSEHPTLADQKPSWPLGCPSGRREPRRAGCLRWR